MRTARAWRAGEAGSVLLGTLMILFVLLILGLALFDSALLDSRLAVASLDDYRALESAQAGMQIALYRLYLHLCGGDAACADPSAGASWADRTIDGAAITSASFAPFIPQTMSFQGSFADPRGDGYPVEEHAGSYAVELKLLTKGQAGAIGLACLTGDAVDSETCPDLVYVRSTGTFGRTAAEPAAVRVIQAVAQARILGAGAGSLAVLAETIIGSPEIHGSVHMVPCGSPPCSPLPLDAGNGVRNNYHRMPGSLRSLVPALPRVTCPADSACAGLQVETLQATVRIGKPAIDDTLVVDIGPRTSIGNERDPLTDPSGKPTMDGVYLGRGCSPEDCSNVISNPASVFSDRPIRAYDQQPPPGLPRLADPTRIVGQPYANYAACGPGVPPSSAPDVSCRNDGMAIGGSGSDFFIRHALRIDAATVEDLWGCSDPPCSRRLLDILAAQGGNQWIDDDFSTTFSCVSGPVQCSDSGGTRVNGWVDGSTPAPGFQVEWDRLTSTISVYQCPVSDPDTSDTCGRAVAAIDPSGPPSGLLPGIYRYKIAFVDSAGQERPVPTGRSNAIRVSSPDESIQLTSIPRGPSGTTARRIYRRPADPCLPVEYCLVATINDNVTQNYPDSNPVSSALTLPASRGVLSHSVAAVYPVLIYIDGRLRLCPLCTEMLYQGHAAILARGDATDITADTASVSIEASFRPFCTESPCRATFPQRNLFTIYTPGNLVLSTTGSTAIRVAGRFHAGNKLRTTGGVDIAGGAIARVLELGAPPPRFWEVRLPLTPTALAARWSVTTVKWKQCPPGSANGQPC